MKYDIIIADLPWKYNSRKAGTERKNKTKFGGGAEKHCDLMADEDIFALAPWVNKVASENCALFLWSVCPKIDVALKVFQTWNFRFTTVAFVWIKTTKDGRGLIYNPGYYTSSNAELVLLGVKGSMRPLQPMIHQVVMSPRTAHSKKPDEVQLRIEQMYPEANRLEMFATRQLENWQCVGNQIDGLDIKDALQELND